MRYIPMRFKRRAIARQALFGKPPVIYDFALDDINFDGLKPGDITPMDRTPQRWWRSDYPNQIVFGD